MKEAQCFFCEDTTDLTLCEICGDIHYCQLHVGSHLGKVCWQKSARPVNCYHLHS